MCKNVCVEKLLCVKASVRKSFCIKTALGKVSVGRKHETREFKLKCLLPSPLLMMAVTRIGPNKASFWLCLANVSKPSGRKKKIVNFAVSCASQAKNVCIYNVFCAWYQKPR